MTTFLLGYVGYFTYARAREADIPINLACLMAVTWPVLAVWILADWFADIWIRYFKH